MGVTKINESDSKDKRYYVIVHNPAGGQYKKVVKGKQAADAHYAEVHARMRDGGVAKAGDRNKTVKQLWDEIVESKQLGLTESTLRAYGRDWKHIESTLGSLRVSRLTNDHIFITLFTKIEAESGSAARYAVEAKVRAMLKIAVRRRLLPRNPLDGVRLPEKVRVKGVPVTPAFVDARRVYDFVGIARSGAVGGEPEMNQAAVAVLIGLGLRASEACGLAVEDFDLEARTVTVQRQVLRTKGGFMYSPVKGDTRSAGVRTIAVPQFVMTALAASRLRNGTKPFTLPWKKADSEVTQCHELIFFSKRGDHPYSSNRLWTLTSTAGAKVGIKGLHSHSFRHTLTTTMSENEVAPIVIDEITGHKPKGSMSVTDYTRVTPKMREKARAVIEAAWADALTEDQDERRASND